MKRVFINSHIKQCRVVSHYLYSYVLYGLNAELSKYPLFLGESHV